MLPENEIENLKKQIISHIEKTFPDKTKEEAKSKILAMNGEEFEEFLKQNKMLQEKNQQATHGNCIFCMIKDKKIPSYILDENNDAIIILEINPISRGHSIAIPKVHSSDKKIERKIYNFSERFAKKLRTKFKPKGIIFSDNFLFGHGVVNIIPIYTNETADSERHPGKKEDLEKIQKMLMKKSRKPAKRKIIKKRKAPSKKAKTKRKTVKEETKITKRTITKNWLPRRIP